MSLAKYLYRSQFKNGRFVPQRAWSNPIGSMRLAREFIFEQTDVSVLSLEGQ